MTLDNRQAVWLQMRHKNWSAADAAWLKRAVAKSGTQEEIAEAVGISRPALVAILNGHKRPRLSTLQAIVECTAAPVTPFTSPADNLQVSLDALTKGSRPRLNEPDVDTEAQSPSPSLSIPEADLSYGMGGTFIDDIATSMVIRELPAEWVRSFTQAPADQLFLCRGIGDSMMPTLLDSDLLLVDRSQTRLKQADRIWVVLIGEIGMIKRLRVEPTGDLTLLSDNETVPPMRATADEIVPIGRVVAVIRKM